VHEIGDVLLDELGDVLGGEGAAIGEGLLVVAFHDGVSFFLDFDLGGCEELTAEVVVHLLFDVAQLFGLLGVADAEGAVEVLAEFVAVDDD
jgi:hypothetical protein